MDVKKKKTNATEQKRISIWIIWLTIVLIGFFGIFASSKPYETSEEFWLPEDASVVNMIKGEYTPISKVSLSGTAVYIPLDDYQWRFRYANVDKSVIVLPKGVIYYLTKMGKNLYVSTTKQVFDMPLHSDPEIKGISRYSEDKENWILPVDTALLKLRYGRDWIAVGFCLSIWTGIVFLLKKFIQKIA